MKKISDVLQEEVKQLSAGNPELNKNWDDTGRKILSKLIEYNKILEKDSKVETALVKN